jgi:hypothetical protein
MAENEKALFISPRDNNNSPQTGCGEGPRREVMVTSYSDVVAAATTIIFHQEKDV